MHIPILATLGGLVALGALLFTCVSYFLTIGASLAEQSVRVIVDIKAGVACIYNLSDGPISAISVQYGGRAFKTEQSFVPAGESTTAKLEPEDAESPDMLSVRYLGVRGLPWQRWADGRVELVCPRWKRILIEFMTWPWLSGELEAWKE